MASWARIVTRFQPLAQDSKSCVNIWTQTTIVEKRAHDRASNRGHDALYIAHMHYIQTTQVPPPKVAPEQGVKGMSESRHEVCIRSDECLAPIGALPKVCVCVINAICSAITTNLTS